MEKEKRPDSSGGCKEVWEEISAYLDGTLDDGTRPAFRVPTSPLVPVANPILMVQKTSSSLMSDSRLLTFLKASLGASIPNSSNTCARAKQNSAVGNEIRWELLMIVSSLALI
jgi:hypothetical protein